jgi:hypothetical protein
VSLSEGPKYIAVLTSQDGKKGARKSIPERTFKKKENGKLRQNKGDLEMHSRKLEDSEEKRKILRRKKGDL